MPFKPYKPEAYAARDVDIVFEFHGHDDLEHSDEKGKVAQWRFKQREGKALSDFSVHRKTDVKRSAEDLGVKKLVPSVARGDNPPPSGIAKLREAQQPLQSPEPEYEMVDMPDAVVEASESDSDSNSFVEVKHEDAGQNIRLPIRSREGGSMVPGPTGDESDADSDWSMV
jgi:hypothetical protein